MTGVAGWGTVLGGGSKAPPAPKGIRTSGPTGGIAPGGGWAGP